MTNTVVIWRFVLAPMMVLIATLVAFLSLRRRKIPGMTCLFIFSLVVALWAAANILFGVDVDKDTGRVMLIAKNLGSPVGSSVLLILGLMHTGRVMRLSWWQLLLLAIEPVVVLVLTLTNWQLPNGMRWFHINETYANSLLVLAILFLLLEWKEKLPEQRVRIVLMVIGALVPLCLSGVNFLQRNPIPELDLFPLAFTITGLAFFHGIQPVTRSNAGGLSRDTVVNWMSDGWMVVDAQDRVADINPAAEKVVGKVREEIVGKPTSEILSNWDNLNDPNVRELDMSGSVKIGKEWRYFTIRKVPLYTQDNRLMGKLIAWRDITEKRKVDEIRQRARNEEFILQQTIASAANQAMNLNDFLADALFQILPSFQSQSGAIFLLEERDSGNREYWFSIGALHGLSEDSLDEIGSYINSPEFITWAVGQQEPYQIRNVAQDERVPSVIRVDGNQFLVIVPMRSEGELLGLLTLLRREGQAYTADELSRLRVVADEMTALISSDRQRQLATVRLERDRLGKALHDSASGHLYGLLQETEVAQAKLEAGAPISHDQVLSSIAEYARQALKEMRLFVYQLQPLDLEREGLVSIITQRLEKVEGRANIKYKMLMDDTIVLPKQVAVTLYFISQEALNNILRHAYAKTITVRLQQTRTRFMLEIEDDGKGFEPKEKREGRMGLLNMRERATQVGGKLQIHSSPGKGTKVSVTIPKDGYKKTDNWKGRS